MVELLKTNRTDSLNTRELILQKYLKRELKTGVFLQTCNRIEWYKGDGDITENIARHLFRVVAGLESALIGETAIAGQVKRAYRLAHENGRLTKSLHKLFQTSFFVAKKVKRETGISKGAMSHGQSVVQILQNKKTNLANQKVTLIGANNLTESIIRFLRSKGASVFFIGNRTFEKASTLASKYDGKAFQFQELPNILEETDILISATSAPHQVLKKEQLPKNKQMILFDLAVPRDIDPRVSDLENMELFNIQEIEQEIIKNRKLRSEEVLKAEAIIEYELERFFETFAKSVNQQKLAV